MCMSVVCVCVHALCVRARVWKNHSFHELSTYKLFLKWTTSHTIVIVLSFKVFAKCNVMSLY